MRVLMAVMFVFANGADHDQHAKPSSLIAVGNYHFSVSIFFSYYHGTVQNKRWISPFKNNEQEGFEERQKSTLLWIIPLTVRKTTLASFLCSFLKIVTSYRCLQCDDVPLPNLCQKVGECGPHELCSVEQYVTTAGSLTYRQRCMDRLNCGNIVQSGLGKRSDLLTCSECCEGDLCNAAGCGEKGFDTTLGPVCYACALQIGTGTCSKIQQCGRDQECSIHPVRRIGAPDNLFETKCLEKNICTAPEVIDPTLVGRKRSTCSICCNSKLCNDFDSRPCVQSPSTIAVVSTKVSTVQTTTGLTSTHESVQTTMQPNPFTTAPVTQQVCEDVPGKLCDVITCSTAVAFNKVNCRKTCNLCGKVTETTAFTSTTASTSRSTTTTALTTRTAPTVVSTTTKTGVSSHTHDPFCFDISDGCKTFLNYCITDEYKDWVKTNCKRSCNYC